MGGKPKSKRSSKDVDKSKSSKKSSKSKDKDKEKLNKSKVSKASKASKSKEKSKSKDKDKDKSKDKIKTKKKEKDTEKSPKEYSKIIKDGDLEDKKQDLENSINNPMIDVQKNLAELSHLNNNNYNLYPLQTFPNLNNNNLNIPISNMQKCEGCFNTEILSFCKECGRAYCTKCDNQIHLVPAYKNHQRVPMSEMLHLRHLCIHHNNPLKLFCDSCNEPICEECQIIGPHNTKLHHIKTIIEAYNEKFKILSNIVDTRIMNDIQMLTNNQAIIQKKIKEVEDKASIIEKEINDSYYKNLDKLRNEKGKRIAVLNFESSKFQKEMINIQDIVNYNKDFNNKFKMNGIYSSNANSTDQENKIEYLLKYKNISENIESIITKPLNEMILDKGIDQMPISDIMETLKMDNFLKLKTLLKVKNDIIWSLILMRKKYPEMHIKQKQMAANNMNVIQENEYSSYRIPDSGNLMSTYVNQKSVVNNNNNNNNNIVSPEDLEINNMINKIRGIIAMKNINFYQFLNENAIVNNKEFITKKNLLSSLQKICPELKEDLLTRILIKYNLHKNIDSISINDFTKILVDNK